MTVNWVIHESIDSAERTSRFVWAGKLQSLKPETWSFEVMVLGGGRPIGDLRCCGVAHFFLRCCGEKNPSLRCCGDLKPHGVRCLHFKVFGVWWNEIIGVIPVSIIFGKMTSRKRSCTAEAAVTFRSNFAVISNDFPVAKFKQKRSKGIKTRCWPCDEFVSEIFLS